MAKKQPKYHWVNRTRVSTEDGSRLLKTQEASKILGVPVGFVQDMIRRKRLAVKGTYAVYGEQRGWLVSEKDVIALSGHPEIIEKKRNYEKWKQARQAARIKTKRPLPKVKVKPLKKRKSIKPDEFQVQALELALRGSDVLVVAPTGAGKTWVAEELARHAIEKGVGFVYASPLKALSNQKYRDFSALFGEETVGIITGDVITNPNAPVLIMTTEIFRNKCITVAGGLERVKWAILDEFHLLGSDRGSAWEEAVIFAPTHISLVCLSATIPNHQEISSWIRWVCEKEVEVVYSDLRPVPLSWRWFIDDKVYTEKTAKNKVYSLQEAKEREYLERRSWYYRSRYDWDDEWDDDWEDDDWEDDDWEDDKW